MTNYAGFGKRLLALIIGRKGLLYRQLCNLNIILLCLNGMNLFHKFEY